MDGLWLEPGKTPLPIKGRALVAWNQADWFTMVMKINFLDDQEREIAYQYRGRLDEDQLRYTYVLQHSHLGRIEGEGWIGQQSIVQRYWVLGDRQRHSGFDTFYQYSDRRYYLASGMVTGHYLTSTMEATLDQQS